MNTFGKAVSGILASFFPSRCLICGREVTGGRRGNECCAACSLDLQPYLGGYCPRCGLLFAQNDPISLCLECRLTARPWEGFGFYGLYQGTLRDVILKYKFQKEYGSIRLLQSLLQKAYSLHLSPYVPDLILPVPLHPARLAARGFNQSLELSRGLAKGLGIEVSGRGLVRLKHTPFQAGLEKKQRVMNVQGVFAVQESLVHGKEVLLVDDIYTTGATVAACARAINQSGARRVQVLVVARAVEA